MNNGALPHANSEFDPAAAPVDTTAPPPDGAAAECGAGLIDVPYERSLFSMRSRLALLFVTSLVFIAGAIVIVNLGLTHAQRTTLTVCLLVAVIAVIRLLSKRSEAQERRRVRAVLHESGCRTVRGRVDRILYGPRLPSPHQAMKEIAACFAGEKLWGVAVRIGPTESLSPLEPIPYAFEPRRAEDIADLDEIAPIEAEDTNAKRPATRLPRGVRRNLMLKGGWLLCFALLFNWVIALIESIEHQRIETRLYFWTLGMLFFAFLPAGRSWRAQFVVMPGALLLRESGWFERGWRLTLFRRSASCALLYPMWKKQWYLVLSDGEQCKAVLGLRAELELALRAWLSPLEPPSVERLSDLM